MNHSTASWQLSSLQSILDKNGFRFTQNICGNTSPQNIWVNYTFFFKLEEHYIWILYHNMFMMSGAHLYLTQKLALAWVCVMLKKLLVTL